MKKTSDIFKILDMPLSVTASLIAIVPFIGWVFEAIYKPSYAQRCAMFYGIPEKYFKQVALNINLLNYLPVIVVLMIMLIILQKKESGHLNDDLEIILTAVYEAIALIFIIAVNDSYLLNIILRELDRRNYVDFVSNHVKIIPYWILTFSVILGGAYTAVFFIVLINQRLKWLKLIKKAIMIFTLLIVIIYFCKNLPIEPEKKSQYEVTFIQDGDERDERVILADLGDQYLTVSYRLPKVGSAYEFYTGNYKLLNKEGLIVTLLRFNSGIKIVNNSSVTLNN